MHYGGYEIEKHHRQVLVGNKAPFSSFSDSQTSPEFENHSKLMWGREEVATHLGRLHCCWGGG